MGIEGGRGGTRPSPNGPKLTIFNVNPPPLFFFLEWKTWWWKDPAIYDEHACKTCSQAQVWDPTET